MEKRPGNRGPEGTPQVNKTPTSALPNFALGPLAAERRAEAQLFYELERTHAAKTRGQMLLEVGGHPSDQGAPRLDFLSRLPFLVSRHLVRNARTAGECANSLSRTSYGRKLFC